MNEMKPISARLLTVSYLWTILLLISGLQTIGAMNIPGKDSEAMDIPHEDSAKLLEYFRTQERLHDDDDASSELHPALEDKDFKDLEREVKYVNNLAEDYSPFPEDEVEDDSQMMEEVEDLFLAREVLEEMSTKRNGALRTLTIQGPKTTSAPTTAAPTTTMGPTITGSSTTTGPTTTSACPVTRSYCPDCGVAPISMDDVRIVNGTSASTNEYPYQVSVRAYISATRSPMRYDCGGSIIKKKWILTAAHCFFDRIGNQAAQNDIWVGYGHNNWNQLTYVQATRYILHENYSDYSRTLANDIALIELPSDLAYETNAAIQPICLGLESDIPYGGKAVVSGWGDLVYNGKFPDQLQEVALDVINITYCSLLEKLPPDDSTVVCALTPFKDTCQGDSGGPLVAQVCPNQWVQIGIVSYGDECAKPNAPGVYTRVSAYRTWIDTNTGSSTTC